MIFYFVSPFLFLVSVFYALVIFFRNFLFDVGVCKVVKLNKPVISVGNISVGGSGKTAVVLEILNYTDKLCVLTRGYKSEASRIKNKSHLVDTSDRPNFYGDEPSLIKLSHPNVTVIVDHNRFRGGQFALLQTPNIKAFILDDGFQHRKLFRDYNLLVFDLDIYLSQSSLLPLGRFREFCSSVKRADLILISKWTHLGEDDLNQAIGKLRKYNVNFEFLNTQITRIQNNRNELKVGGKCVLVSGLGRPDLFELDVLNTFKSIEILEHIKYSDHYKYSSKELESLFRKAEVLGADLVCSEKDYIKLKKLGHNLEKIYYTVQEAKLSQSSRDKILKVIESINS